MCCKHEGQIRKGVCHHMKKKIMIIGAVIIVSALAFFCMTVWNARKSMTEAVEACNAAIREYNEGIEPYNEAAKKTAFANEEFEGLLKEAQTQIDSGKEAYDEDTLDELMQKVKKASKALVEVPELIEPYELMEITDSFDKNILSAAEQKARETELTVRDAIKEIPKPVTVPDYTKEISSVKKAQKAYADSVQQLLNVTAPGDDFVAERLGSIDTVTGTAAVTKKNDPNRLLGEKGGYIGCVYFRDKRIELENLPEEVPSPETISLVEEIWPGESEEENSDDQSEEGETAETASTVEQASTGETAETASTGEQASTGETAETASTSEFASTGETAAAALPEDKKTEKDKKKEEKRALEIIHAGTAGGGAVEVYSTEEEARDRDQYLAFFEGSIMDPGGHAVEKTCVIRVSRHLEETEQQELIEKIRKALLEIK